MKWSRENLGRLPVKSWCAEPEAEALKQAANLADHPAVSGHVALMPDCHVGYGMPIGGVIACDNALIPNAVGVDIGCGMCAVRTNVEALDASPEMVGKVLHGVGRSVPVGEGRAHRSRQSWDVLDELKSKRPGGVDSSCWNLAYCNLGTLGGGNHFIEIQKGSDGLVWLMIHSGSRNLGYRIADHYHKLAVELDRRIGVAIPDKQLAFLPADSPEGMAYVRDMDFALEYARENRRRIMAAFKVEFSHVFNDAGFGAEINIHHNYAALEEHFGKRLWVHRKGATSAKKGETGIIPGSMGTASYIVEGLGNPESFMSCSHGAGRRMGRSEACRRLSKDDCEKAMRGIVFEGFKPKKGRFGRRGDSGGALFDLEEAPQAYKDIEDVISSELDLVAPKLKLHPLGVVKG